MVPTLDPTRDPLQDPTNEPSNFPSPIPTSRPSFHPTTAPTPAPTFIPNINATSAQFNSNGLSINIVFDTATNQIGAPGAFDCGLLVDNVTVSLLGLSYDEGGAECQWKSTVILVIFTGSDAEIEAGHNITFLGNTDCFNDSICTEYYTNPMSSQVISIEEPSDPVDVEASIMGPEGFGR